MPPFLLGDSYGDARMGLPRLFGLCAAFLFASSVGAAVTIDLGPSDYRNFGPNGSHTGGGIRSSVGGVVRIPPGGSLSIMRNPVVPYGSLGGALRSLGRTTPQAVVASAGMAAIFAAMDWVFDEGAWKKNGQIDNIDPELGLWTFRTQSFPTPEGACSYAASWYQSQGNDTFELTSTNIVSNVQARCLVTYTTAAGAVNPNFELTSVNRTKDCPALFSYNPQTGRCYQSALVPLTDGDYSDLTAQLPSLPAGDVAGAAGDAQRQIGNPLPGYTDTQITGPSSFTGPETTSTSTDPVTGETTVTTTNTTTNISYGDTTITTTNTTTTTTYQNGQETSTTVTTETPGELPVDGGGGLPPAGEWPGFCDWATVVCDWFNWTQEEPPPDVDLPQVIDDDFFSEKTISFGAKSCPPDHEINLTPFLETTVGVSFQPLCDFASLIYYMVMAASYIIAAYISIGVARNG